MGRNETSYDGGVTAPHSFESRMNMSAHSTSHSESSHSESREVHQRQKGRGTQWTDYIPLMVIVVATMAAAAAKEIAYGSWSWMPWMQDFMGFFLVVFSLFKFFDMEGFADGFQMYDLLAKRLRFYAHVYPFVECGLGLGYLARWHLDAVYAVTVIVMLFGALGVINALRQGLDLECACMGTVLKVPLSTVALLEDLGMAAMAGAMWWMNRH